MTFRISIDTTAISQALSGLSKAVDDMTPIMRQLGNDLAAITEQNFDSEGARIAAKWKPSRRAIEQKGQTLRKDGHLVASISVGGPDHVQEVGPNYVFVGTNVVYAAIHQLGGQAGRGRKVTIPARPFFGLNAQDEQDIAETIAKALDAALK
jgi:phage virion morphogenesis protein